jgi:hypothetical protein
VRCVLGERGCVHVGCSKRCETHHTLSSMSMSRTALLRGATRVLQRITTRPTVSSSQCLQSHTLLSPCCARCASTGAGADTHPFVSQLVDDQDKRAKAAEVRACASLKAPSTAALEIVWVAGRRDAVV